MKNESEALLSKNFICVTYMAYNVESAGVKKNPIFFKFGYKAPFQMEEVKRLSLN